MLSSAQINATINEIIAATLDKGLPTDVRVQAVATEIELRKLELMYLRMERANAQSRDGRG